MGKWLFCHRFAQHAWLFCVEILWLWFTGKHRWTGNSSLLCVICLENQNVWHWVWERIGTNSTNHHEADYRESTAEQVVSMEFSDFLSIAITLCRFLLFFFRHSVFKSQHLWEIKLQQNFEQPEPENTSGSANRMTLWPWEMTHSAGCHWGKWRCRIRSCEHVGKWWRNSFEILTHFLQIFMLDNKDIYEL